VRIGRKGLPADTTIPENASGVVVFAHGSGSSRLSPRNREVAHALNQAGLATVLFDLLTPEEAEDRRNVFDIPLLARRMGEAIAAVRENGDLRGMRIGLFGASTGAAAALRAAAKEGGKISAVVSRGGRPDLAFDVLGAVTAPTLLIVGGLDEPVITLNEKAFALLRCEKQMEVVPGATHLFEETGAMEHVIALASRWFTTYLGKEAG
jgi:pimeloyl-ACP methyl ester carboxylesterase